jgi:YegS/Rv2252/BmrU family lipid kinase
MTLPLVIINPESAGGATRDAWPRIASDLRSHFGAFSLVFTERAGQGTELAADAARKQVKLIIACGGDGTISEVANGILQSGEDAELGILPSGTGGDFRRSIGIPARARDAADILRNGRSRRIDVGRITFINHDCVEETRYFLGVASFGMSAAVIERVKEGGPDWLPSRMPKWLSGRVSFGASMLQVASASSSTKVVVQLDNKQEQHFTLANFCVANARYFGGGMKIAPGAKLDDGQFDVISIGDLGAARIMTNAPRIYTGTHLSMPQVNHTLAKKVLARAANKDTIVILDIDGELPGQLPASFQILPSALKVRCPAANK